ncbi:MAG: hypothetical protein RL088_3936 [Verrucomicrobiota bacterium]
MNQVLKYFFLCIAILSLLSFSGCEAIREHSEWREHRRSDSYALGLIYARRPALRGETLSVQKAHWRAESSLEQASYFYALVRFDSDPDSHYRIIIVEQRIPHPGSQPIVTLRDGFARDYWHHRNEYVRERRHVILSPRNNEPHSK